MKKQKKEFQAETTANAKTLKLSGNSKEARVAAAE